jgi:hypothetical protein
MVSKKRIFIATIFGFIAGVFCFLLGKYWLKINIDPTSFLVILLHRALLGFVIGISALRIHWVLHGILLGLIVGIPDYHFIYMIQGDWNCGLYFIAGAIWGCFIEFFTSIVFKAKAVRT